MNTFPFSLFPLLNSTNASAHVTQSLTRRLTDRLASRHEKKSPGSTFIFLRHFFSFFTLKFLIWKLDTIWPSYPPKSFLSEPPHWTPLRKPALTVVPPRWDRESAPIPRSPRWPNNRYQSLGCSHSSGVTGHLQASCNTLPSLARSWRLTKSLGLRYVLLALSGMRSMLRFVSHWWEGLHSHSLDWIIADIFRPMLGPRSWVPQTRALP